MADKYRLRPDLQAELQWYWCDADADLGVCSGGDIEHRAPPKSAPRLRRTKDESLEHMWREVKCAGDRHANSKDDPADCTMASGGDPFVMDRTPLPEWARRIVSKDRERASRIYRTVTRLVRQDGGPAHERILYRVYGPVRRHPICYGRVGSELAPLVEYTAAVAERIVSGVTPPEAGEAVLRKGTNDAAVGTVRRQAEALLVAASRAYGEAYELERNERRRERAAKFAALLGAE